MPTYDYKCSACGQVFELFHGMNENPDARCPECGSAAERQLSGGAGIIFKGSGFYSTDYSSRNSSCTGPTCCGRDEPCDSPPCSEE